MSSGGARLRPSDRLRSSKDFRRVGREGKRRSSSSFVVLVAPRYREGPGEASAGAARLGVTVSRRVGSAVVRNRVKRHIREWFRRRRGKLGEGVDWVVIARAAASGLSGPEVDRELSALAEHAVGRDAGPEASRSSSPG